MAEPSLGAAWDETAAFARRAWPKLFGIAFATLALPAAIVQALAPVAPTGRVPEPGLWLLLLPLPALLGLFGALTISFLTLTAGPSFAAAIRRYPFLLAAALLVLAAGAALLALPLLLGPLGWLAAAPLLLFLWSRFLPLTPVAAVEPLGPLALLARSWRLTSGRWLPLAGFLLLVLILSFVILATVGALAGVAAVLTLGRPEPGSSAIVAILLVSALLQSVIGGLYTVMSARLYARLAAASPTSGS